MTRTRAILVLAAAVLQMAVVAAVPLGKMRTLRTGRTVFLTMVPVDPYSMLSGYYAILNFEIGQPGETDWEFYGGVEEALAKKSGDTAKAARDAEVDAAEAEAAARDARADDDVTTTTADAASVDKVTSPTAEPADEWSRTWEVRNKRIERFKKVFDDGAIVYAVIEETTGPAWRLVGFTPVKPQGLAPNQAFLRGRERGWRIEYGIEQFFMPETIRHEVDDGIRDRLRECRAEVKVDENGNSALVALHIADKVYKND